jgi:DNA polymerase-3 subunit alpha
LTAFVHLHVHTGYSLKESCLRIPDAIAKAKSAGMTALAITDTNALYGVVPFYKAAREAGIHPILGAQLQVDMGSVLDTVVLLARNLDGYRDLCQLVTAAHQKPRQPHVTLSELAERSLHLFVLVAGGESQLLRQYAAGQDETATDSLVRLVDVVPTGQVYVDIQDHGVEHERRGLPGLLAASRKLAIPLAATNDVHYQEEEDATVQRVLAAIDTASPASPLASTRYHLATEEEMLARFVHFPEALANTVEIAQACQVELPLGQVRLPVYPVAAGESSAEVLRKAATAGAVSRYGTLTTNVIERLHHELEIITRLGFADYFLVVADFIRFAHRQGISTGPGRGSAAGSLVAYALRITDVDPLANHLLFERFLNPERVSWPDIDTDFEFERRGEVIQYVQNRYGAHHVAQIGTFGTLAARAALRDGGRALGEDNGRIDRLAKLIPQQPGVTLCGAREQVPALRQMLESDPRAHRLYETAIQLEGLPRHPSIHAAGVIISPLPIADLVPVVPGPDGIAVTQFPMEDVESLGFVKMDFLGLKTLTLIDGTIASVQRRSDQRVDFRKLPTDDAATFAMLSRGQTSGCFQLESSSGVRRVLRDLKPTSMEDLIAVISLYRPGPMDNIPTFIAAKHGRQPIHYPHPDLQPILADTYGVIVYQEQIMQIASKMAGFSLGQADLLRRAVSKKKRDVLDAERERFVSGCRERGYGDDVANGVYDLIVRFADYGFNRSHAAAYAVLSYRTAYLRAHHPADFFATLMTLASAHPDKVRDYAKDAAALGIRVLPPSVQYSDGDFCAESDTSIRSGLLSLRGVGRAAVAELVRVRKDGGSFSSLVDLVQRVSPRVCNRKAMESLLLGGALADLLPTSEASSDVKMKLLSSAYEAVQGSPSSSSSVPLFGLADAESGKRALRSEIAPMEQSGEGLETLFIRYRSSAESRAMLSKVRQILADSRGTTPVVLYDEESRRARRLEEKWNVTPSVDVIAELESVVGIGNVKLRPSAV